MVRYIVKLVPERRPQSLVLNAANSRLSQTSITQVTLTGSSSSVPGAIVQELAQNRHLAAISLRITVSGKLAWSLAQRVREFDRATRV